jgi:VCBS repeat-containing protein
MLAGVWSNSIGPVTSSNAPTYVYNLIATLTVVAMNHPPVPQDDQIEVIAFGLTDEIVGDPRIPGSLLDNDTDPDQGDFPAFAHTVMAPACGTVTLLADGTFMYISTTDQCLTDSFQYGACDTFQTCALATVHVSISVPSPNHPPVPQDDQVEVAAFGSTDAIVGDPIIPSSVLDNDTDPDQSDHVASATIAVNPVCGNLTLNSNGTFTYQSTTDNCVTDSFKYNACDTHTLCAQATVHINISGADPDYPPVAIDDSIQVTPGGTSTVLVGGATSLLGNDFDPNQGQPISVDLPGTYVLSAGTLTLNADGTFSYQNTVPNAASDFHQYFVCDDTPPFGLCGTGTITITISNVPNHLPVAVDDAIQVALGSTTSVLVGGASTVLANDSDPDGDTLTAKLVGPSPSHGQLTFNPDGTFIYQHNGDSATSDSFTYQVSDIHGAANSATVTITIGGSPNSLPVAADDAIQVAIGGAATTLIGGASSVLTNDTDPDLGETATLTADMLSLPAHGQLTLNLDGTFSYQHNGDVATNDSFAYEARDVHGAASAATVTITIGNGAVNLPPITVDDAIQVAPNGVATVLVDNSNSLLDNDFDPNPGDTATLTVQQVGIGPVHGTLTLHPDGTFSYHAFNGPPTTDSFQYQACDIHTACSSPPATVSITISNGAADNLPFAIDDAIQVLPSGTATTLVGGADTVLANDSDPDPGETVTLVAQLLGAPTHGTLTFNSDGTFNYQHNGDAATSDSFVYEARDVRGGSSAAVVTITIGNGPVNHLPFAVDDAIDIAPGDTSSELVGGATSVLANDVDPDSGETAALTAKLVGTGPGHGTLVFNDDGTFSYENSIGDPATTDEFHYEACDIHGACAEAVVTISIDNGLTNHLPIVVDDEIQVVPNGLTTTLVGGASSVLANDFDPDAGETATLSAVEASGLVKGSGTLTLNADGSFSYQNQDPALSPDSFFYEACDVHGACKGGMVTVTITNDSMNHVPIAIDDAIEVASGGTATILVGGSTTVLSNDSDADPGDDLTAELIGTPNHGIVEMLTVDGGFIYHNNAGDPATTDSFVYQACDVHGACAAATVSIAIDTDMPTVVCVVPTQVDVVGDVVNLDLSLLFTAPAGQALTYSAINLPPSLSIVGALLSGTLQASDVPGSPYASTLTATTVPGGVSASEDVMFQVLPAGEIVFRNSFDGGSPAQACQ